MERCDFASVTTIIKSYISEDQEKNQMDFIYLLFDSFISRHNRFLRSLKSDTLLIVDNFNTTATRDSFLPVVMKYRCRVVFTTRSRMENYPTIFNPTKHIQLNKRISTLTEEIEELKTRKNQLMYEVGCQSDAEIKETEKKISKMKDYLEKMRAQQPKLTSQLAADEKSFTEAREKISPQQEDALLDARVPLRDEFRNQICAKLREVFGQKFQYDRLSSAEEQIDRRLNEDSDLFRERTTKLRHEQEMERRKNQPNRPKKKSKNYEL